MRRLIISMLALCVLLTGCSVKSSLRYPPDTWLRDNDRIPFPISDLNEKKRRGRENKKEDKYVWRDDLDEEVTEQMQVINSLVGQLGDYVNFLSVSERTESMDVDNFDEVIDSTWFQNRAGRFGLRAAEDEYDKLLNFKMAAGRKLVLRVATNRNMVLFLIKDSKGKLFYVAVDLKERPETATSSMYIASRLLYYAGYNVLPNYATTIDVDKLEFAGNAFASFNSGRQMPLDAKVIERVKSITGHGVIEAVVAKPWSGKAIGPFRFYGKRGQDPNDRIRHEHRRELRGLRMFCALMDWKYPLSLDVFDRVRGNDGYVDHNLAGLWYALGEAVSIPDQQPEIYTEGFEDLIELGVYNEQTIKTLRKKRIKAAIAEIQYKNFNPQKWKPGIYYAAFSYMTRRDGFWAAKNIMLFDDELIDSLMQKAFADAERREYVSIALKQRRNKIGRYWFSRVNPLDDFEVKTGARIKFRDLGIVYGLEYDSATRYRYRLSSIARDYNYSDWIEFEHQVFRVRDELLQKMDANKIYAIQIETKREGAGWWMRPVDILVKKLDSGRLKMMGIFRR